MDDDEGAAIEPLNLKLHFFRELAYHIVRLSDSAGPRLARFLAGPDTLFEPDPLPTYDAFISFTAPDFLIASDLTLKLNSRGLNCFLANTTIAAGSLWNDELRIALKASRNLVLVASGQVAGSSWALSEIGAAWILDIAIIVVPAGDTPWVPAPLLARDDVRLVSLDDITTLTGLVTGWRAR
ncbi:toll/interleukin-1 receptor domain-containing protein [Arthrobacter sp. 754]|uniref:toll/interleukin-1 receptor domain-containing protein n=1 Tax=Arthrobacter sp. 754 TaxID=3156315 RepID=UPI0033980AE2